MMLAARPQPARPGTIAASLAADVEAGTAQRCEPDGFLDARVAAARGLRAGKQLVRLTIS
jgi:hypothetical protein